MPTPEAWYGEAERLRRTLDSVVPARPSREREIALIRAIKGDLDDMVQDFDGHPCIYADVLDDYFADLLP